MSFAICVVTAGSIPNACSPMRASPESFRRMRRNTGADISGRLYQRGRGGGSRIEDNPQAKPLQEEGRREDLLFKKTPFYEESSSLLPSSCEGSVCEGRSLCALPELESHEPRHRDVL